jgi:hypothetical protein
MLLAHTNVDNGVDTRLLLGGRLDFLLDAEPE